VEVVLEVGPGGLGAGADGLGLVLVEVAAGRGLEDMGSVLLA